MPETIELGLGGMGSGSGRGGMDVDEDLAVTGDGIGYIPPLQIPPRGLRIYEDRLHCCKR